MDHGQHSLLKTAFKANFSEFKYCVSASVISILGVVPLLISILLLYVSVFRDMRVYIDVAILDWVIGLAVFLSGIGFSAFMNKIAERVSQEHVETILRTSWEFADRYATDNPSELKRCKELNPEFARRLTERQDSEKRLDDKIARIAQEVRREREQKRQTSNSKGSQL